MASSKAARSSLDLGTVAGLLVGMGAIIGGLALEGGNIRDLAQVTGGMIVLGGTLGAVMMTTQPPHFDGGGSEAEIRRYPAIVRPPQDHRRNSRLCRQGAAQRNSLARRGYRKD